MLHDHRKPRFIALLTLLCCLTLSSFAQTNLPDGCANFNDLDLGPGTLIEDGELFFSTTPNNNLFIQDFHPILGSNPNGFDYFDAQYLLTGGDALMVDFSQLPAHTESLSFEFLQYYDTLAISVNGMDTVYFSAGSQDSIDLGNNIFLVVEEESNVPSPWHAGIMTITGDVQQLYLHFGAEAMFDNFCYDLQTNCAVHEVTASYNCTPNGVFYVELNLDFQNTSDSFQVAGNGNNYGTFAYQDLPIRLGPFQGDGQTDYEFVAIDQQNPNCQNFIELGPIDCPTGGPCVITNVTASASDCNANNQYTVTIDFDFRNVGNMGFLVIGNGNFYGAYDYASLPVTLPVLFDADGSILQFNIFDLADPSCINFAEVGPVDCNDVCEIHPNSIIVDPGNCNNDGTYELYLDFEYSNPGNDFFDVFDTNGDLVGTFRLAELPLTIPNFPGSGSNTDRILICINDNQNCCAEQVFDVAPCPNPCEIGEIRIDRIECVNDVFFIKIDFDKARTSDSFYIQGNGQNYGLYSYSDLPVTLGPLAADGTTFYEFVVIDQEHPDCRNFNEYGTVLCDPACEIHPNSIIIDPGNCNPNGTYEVYLDFEVSNPGNDFFDVFAENGDLIGTFRLSELPLTIPNFRGNGGNTDVIVICINDNPNCCIEKEFDVIPCTNPCEIGEVRVDKIECVNGEFYVKIDFDYARTSDSFYIRGNGINYGLFSYDDLPIVLGPLAADNQTFYEFVVIDADHPDCRNFNEFGIVSCGQTCEIFDLRAEALDCNNDGSYGLVIDFEVSNPGNDFFEVFGENGDFIGFYRLAELPLTLPNFRGNGGNTDIVKVCINDVPDCCARVEFDAPNCNGVCEIGKLEFDIIDCIGSEFYIRIDFEYANTNSDTFNLRGNGQNYGSFLYRDLPIVIGPLAADGQTQYEFVAIDAESPNCSNFVEVGTVTCNTACDLERVSAQPIACNPDGTFSVLIDFEYLSPPSDSFWLYFNNTQFSGTYAYGDMPLLIPSFPATPNNIATFTAMSTDSTCILTYTFLPLDCSSCELFNLETSVSDCDDDDRFDVTIDFDFRNIGNIGFQVLDNQGNAYGPYNYNELPITLEDFDASPGGVLNFTIFDILNFNCSLNVDVDHPDCDNFCDGFEMVQLGDYPAADFEEDEVVFMVKTVPVYMLPFTYADGSTERRLLRIEEVSSNNYLPITGHALWTGNSTALFDFTALTEKVSRVSLDIFDGHPEYNIAVNGEPVQFVSNLNFLPPNIAPGVKLEVKNANNVGGVLQLIFTGDIQSIQIGGLESYIDNLCIESEPYADRECIQFEGLPCCLAITPANYDAGTVIHVENRVLVSYEGGTIWIENQGRCGNFTSSTGNHLFIDGRLGLDFTELPEAPDEVSFNYSSCSDVASIRFNDLSDFIRIFLKDTSYTTASGFQIFVQTNNNTTNLEGRITIKGTVERLLLSGQGFGIDNICFTNPDGIIVVWPGDANNDNIANHFDLLNIALAFSEVGLNRGSVDASWDGIASSEWGRLFSDQETDFMHADCNGDGRIDQEDVEVLVENYGETHGSYPTLIELPADENDPALYLDMSNIVGVRDGGAINIPLRLGTDNLPTEEIYGIAFTLSYDPEVIDPSSLELNYQDSWLGEYGTEVIAVEEYYPQEGRIEVALSRIDKVDVAGSGNVASVIGIIDNIAGKVTTNLDVDNVKAINAQGQRIPIFTEGGGIEIITSDINLPMEDRLGLFPNPAHQTITISSPVNIKRMEIYDVLGRRMTSLAVGQKKQRVNVADWASGIYYATISLTGGGVVVKKFEVVKH